MIYLNAKIIFILTFIASLTYEQTLKATKYCQVNNEKIQKKAKELKKSTPL